MYRRSVQDPAGFWSDIASEFYWREKWGQQVYFENLDIRKGKIQIEVSDLSVYSSLKSLLPTFVFLNSGSRVE